MFEFHLAIFIGLCATHEETLLFSTPVERRRLFGIHFTQKFWNFDKHRISGIFDNFRQAL